MSIRAWAWPATWPQTMCRANNGSPQRWRRITSGATTGDRAEVRGDIVDEDRTGGLEFIEIARSAGCFRPLIGEDRAWMP